jgi:hypothetical protein
MIELTPKQMERRAMLPPPPPNSTTKFAIYRYLTPTDPTSSTPVKICATQDDVQRDFMKLLDLEDLRHPEWTEPPNRIGLRKVENAVEVYTTADEVLRLKFELFEVVEYGNGTIRKVQAVEIEADQYQEEAEDDEEEDGNDDDDEGDEGDKGDKEEMNGAGDTVSQMSLDEELMKNGGKVASSKPLANGESDSDDEVTPWPLHGNARYALYLIPDPTSKSTDAYLLFSSESLNDARREAKVVASGVLKTNRRTKKSARSVREQENVLNIMEKGRTVLRYEIVEGRTFERRFVSEEEWMAAIEEKRRPDTCVVAYWHDPSKMVTIKTNAREESAAEDAEAPNDTPEPEQKASQVVEAGAVKKLKAAAAKGRAGTPRASRQSTPVKKNIAAIANQTAKSRAGTPRASSRQSTPARKIATPEPGKLNPHDIFCVCRKPLGMGETLMGCEAGDADCPYNGWFHLACLGMDAVPEEDWWCPRCRQAHKKEAAMEDV